MLKRSSALQARQWSNFHHVKSRAAILRASARGSVGREAQRLKSREESIERVATSRGFDINDQTQSNWVEKRLYGTTNDGRHLARNTSQLNGMQGLGDNEPLSLATAREQSNLERLTGDVPESDLLPETPFTPLMAKRMQTGSLWPTPPTDTDRVRIPKRLGNESSSSPSSQRFTALLEYHIRRSLKACPVHIAEGLDFSQIMIDRVFGSRRSNNVYVVWSTVNPNYREVAEPLIEQLGPWVRQLIIRYMNQQKPAIPMVRFVYNTGGIPEAMDRKLMGEMKRVINEASETIEDRVEKIKLADSAAARLKSVPWFMPYLWAKDQRAVKNLDMQADLAEVKKRQGKRMDEMENHVNAGSKHVR